MPPKVREVIRRLREDGWVEQKTGGGDHRQFEHPTKPGKVTVPGKPSEDVRPGTWHSIQKQAGWRWR
jgi:predicted RNA binding protein YcfA (HicA-like mRNA interferase family)